MQVIRDNRAKRAGLGFVGALGLALTAVFVAGPAQASTPSDSGAVERTQGTLAAAPTTSPAAPSAYIPDFKNVPCGPDNFCAAFWDPEKKQYLMFDLEACQRYELSGWLSGGVYENRTGSTAYFYDKNGNVVRTIPAGAGNLINWSTVASISSC